MSASALPRESRPSKTGIKIYKKHKKHYYIIDCSLKKDEQIFNNFWHKYLGHRGTRKDE